MVTLHPDSADLNCKHSRLTYRACNQLPLDLDEIDASIDKKILKTLHDLLVNLEALDIGRKPDIDSIKKDRGEIFS